MTFQDVAGFCLDWQSSHTKNMAEGADQPGTRAHKGSVKRKRNKTNQWRLTVNKQLLEKERDQMKD